MKQTQKQMISAYVKEARLAKGYTQKELSDLSNISVRSIQRIENGDILPRIYTLKTLSEVLGISFEALQKTEIQPRIFSKINKGQKIILSIGISVFLLLLSWAFIAQSSRFPETNFEFFVFSALVLLVITVVLVTIWRTKS
jgi:transcriptional regulator with XRE-family HTH domain